MKPTYGQQNNSYLAAGEFDGLFKLVTEFYRVMSTEPFAKIIRDLHPKDLEISIDKLARFLSGWLGGPKIFQEKYGSISIPRVHCPFHIDQAEHDAWLKCMKMALEKQSYEKEFKEYLLLQLAVPAGRILTVNRQQRDS